MQNKYEKQGFALIAMHRQGADLKDKVLGLARSSRVNYSITQGGSLRGDDSRGIPRAFLFDETGKCVFEGRPGEVDSKIEELVAKAPHWLTGGVRPTQAAVAKIAKKLKSGKDFGKIAGELEKLASKGGPEAKEATALHARLLAYAGRQLETAKASEATDIIGAARSYKQLGALFKGLEAADAATGRLATLKKDKVYQRELKAAKLLSQVEAFAGRIKTAYKLEHPANRGPAQAIRKLVMKLHKKYGDTQATTKAKEIAAGLGL